MRMTTLEINRFGRFSNQRITFPDTPLIAVYGENEAGKSTIMQFILDTWFGYPSGNELKRWLDGTGEAKAGGSLLFTGNDGARYRLERTSAENAAPVLIKNGVEKCDSGLMLHGISRILYQDVFCFDLEGLRGIEKKKPAELNNLLLGAGMIGSRELASLEQTLSKKEEALFRKKGKNPELNRLFRKLETSEKTLHEWSEKMDSYRELRSRSASEQKSSDELEEQKRTIQDQFREWSVFASVRPMIIGYREMIKEISALDGAADFPADGRSRYEELQKEIKALAKEMNGLEEQISLLDQSIAAKPVRTSWLNAEGELTAWFRAALHDEQEQRDAARLVRDRNAVQLQLNALLDRLGTSASWDEDTLRKASVAVPFIHRIEKETADWKARLSERQQAEGEQQIRRKMIEQFKEKLDRFHETPEGENTGRRENTGHEPRQNRKTSQMLPFAAMLATLGLAVFSALFFTFPAALPVILTGGFLTWLLFLNTADRQSSEHPAEGAVPEQRHEAEISLIRDQFVSASTAFREKQAVLDQLAAEQDEQSERVDALLLANGYPGCAIDWADEAVKLVTGAKALQEKSDEMVQSLDAFSVRHRQVADEKARLTDLLDLPEGDPDYIERQFRTEKEKDTAVQELKAKRDVYVTQRDLKKSKLDHLYADRTALLHRAGTDDPDAFLEQAGRAERRVKLKDQRDQRRIQMLEQSGGEKRLLRFEKALDEGKWSGMTEDIFKNQLDRLDGKIRETRDRLLKVRAELGKLEENDSYREALDSHQQLLTEANDEAREWMICRTAQWAIETAKDRYRNQKLPRILHHASDFFKRITSGIYISLEVDPSGGFIVGRDDGRHFSAEQLSRGTAEQLYLSLRLALADQVDPDETLPVIIDEGLVNFDRRRAGNVLEILKETAADRQIILFTCHETFLSEMPAESVVRLGPAKV